MLVLLVICFLALKTTFANNKPNPVKSQPDLVVKLDRIRPELVKLLTRNSKRGVNILPLESRQYKCRLLNTLYRDAKIANPNFLDDMLSVQMKNMLDNCATRDFRIVDFFSQAPIFPGTLWCGQGNLAENYHDLGYFNETDACCRDHDYCDDIIRPGRTKYNLANPYRITRLHCKCDSALRQCFQKVNSPISNTVGYIFFSLLQTQCFDFDHPASRCLIWKRGAVREYCVKYELKEDQPKIWQWFDQEPYF